MALTINTNVASLDTQRHLGRTTQQVDRALQRLSSGLRINSAKDDAAGLAISDRFTSAIRGLNQAVRNANDGISLAQTAEGALQESTNLLQRMRELAVQSANDTNAASDRQSIQDEVEQIKSELDRIASTTEFNGRKLLDGSSVNLTFHVGIRANQNIVFNVQGAGATDLSNSALADTDKINSNANQGTGSASNATANIVNTNNVIAAQTLSISGSEGSATVNVAAGDTAETIASTINASTASTGVSASAETTATLSGLSNDGTVTFTLGSGGTTATISASVSTSDLSNLADEINNKSGTTGVTATVNGASLTLRQADGKNIRIEDFTHSVANATINTAGADSQAVALTTGGNDSTVVSGVVSLDSFDAFTASSNVANTAGSIFNAAANGVLLSQETLVSSVDVTTQAGANSALKVIDAGIATIDKIRGGLGAVQNRFEATIANLQNVSENVSAARSRVQDADFAAETSALTKAQILQQAGIAILAQSNQIQQSVLSLLQ